MPTYETDPELFEAIFSDFATELSLTQKFLRGLIGYLNKTDIKEAHVLSDWIRDGKPMSTFTCRPRIRRALEKNLKMAGIPFLVCNSTKGRIGFITRDIDTPKVESIKQKTLEQKASVCLFLSAQELQNIVFAKDLVNQEVVYICDLSKQDVSLLKELIREGYGEEDESYLGIAKMNDGTYTVLVPGIYLFSKKGNRKSFVEVFLTAKFLLNGSQNKRNRFLAETHEDARKMLFVYPRHQGIESTPVWFYGRGQYFLKASKDSFIYGYARKTSNGIIYESLLECDKTYETEESFQEKLYSCFAEIDEPAYSFDSGAALRHFTGESRRTISTMDDLRLRECAENLSRTVVEMVEERLDRSYEIDYCESQEEKFRLVMEKSSSLLDAAAQNLIEPGYTEQQTIELQETVQEYGLTLRAFEDTFETLKTIETLHGRCQVHLDSPEREGIGISRAERQEREMELEFEL